MLSTAEVGLGSALGLGAGRVARVVAAALGGTPSLSPEAPLLVFGDEVARAVQRAGLPVKAAVAAGARAPRHLEVVEVPAEGLLPVPDDAFGGAIVARLDGGRLVERLAEIVRVVGDGGLVVVASPIAGLLRKPPAPESLAGALLHARLVDLEQLEAGSTRVTLGRVRRSATPRTTP